MQPKFTLKKRGIFFKLTPMFLILFCLSTGKINAQCTWTAATVVPVPILDAPAVTIGTNLCTFGGVANGAIISTTYRFDGTTWTTVAPVPAALEFSSAVTDGTNAFILGGALTGTGVPQTTMYRYNVATNNYTALAPFTVGTWNQGTIYLAGKIYKFGGTGPGTGSATALEIYDVATNIWTLGAPLPVATSFPGAFANGGFIYCIGGLNSTGTVATAVTYRYDPVANVWNDAAIADLPATRWGPASGFYNGQGLVCGGYVGGSVTANISNTAPRKSPETE